MQCGRSESATGFTGPRFFFLELGVGESRTAGGFDNFTNLSDRFRDCLEIFRSEGVPGKNFCSATGSAGHR